MKKTLKWIAISAGISLLFLVIAVLAIPFLIPTKAAKDFATARLSETLNRTVSVESVSLNIFEGIKLEGIYIANHKDFSKKPFVKADSIILRYAFWPLFKRKVLIYEAVLIGPEILIEKNLEGKSNLEDIGGKKAKPLDRARGNGKRKAKGKGSIDLVVNTFKIKNGRLTYDDYQTGTNELKDVNLEIKGITLALIKPMEIEAKALASYLEKDFPLSIKSKVSVNKSFDRYSIPLLSVQIAEESFSCPLEIKNVKEGPEIDFNLSSQNLSIDTLLGILSTRSKTPSPKPKPGEITKNVKASIKSLSDTLKVKGNIDIQNAIFQKLKIDRFKANLTLAGKKVWLKLKDVSGYGGTLSMDGRINLAALTYEIKPLNLKGFNAGPFVNDYIDSFMPKQLNMKNKAEGKLDIFLSLSGRGVEMPAVFDKVKIDGVAVLTKGRLKNIKSLENIAEKYNISFLKQDLLVKGLRAEMELKNRILTVKDLDLRDTDVEVAFKGDLDYNTMEYKPGNRLTLKLSPSVSKELPKEFSVFKDDRGFVNLDFELQGSLSAPIPSPRLEKPIEKAVSKLKIKIEAKKIELEQKAKEEAQKEAEKLKKKAEEKIKKILKY